MKYNYDKVPFKALSVGPFLAIDKTRDAKIAAAPDSLPVSEFNANRLAKALHPKVQHAVISEVTDHGDAKSFLLRPDKSMGTLALAYFRAGQYVSLQLDIGEAKLNKPYSIRSNPGDALGSDDTSYTITVKRSAGGYASEHILNNWKQGDKLRLSGPQGEFYYQRLRDAATVIGLAGGSGITPFYSMATAIADGIEDFNLTVLYGSRTKDNILLRDELDEAAARSGGKVKIVHVLSDEKADGYEHGFLTADIIKKYAPQGDYSVFMCGPRAMYDFEDGELEKLALKRRRVRRELFGEYGDPARDPAYPAAAAGKSFKLTVLIRGQAQTIDCLSGQTLLSAMEQAGIRAPSRCRSGDCGWCHSRLVDGQVHMPESVDGRRLADLKFGWIHPCCTYPLTDLCIDVPVVG